MTRKVGTFTGTATFAKVSIEPGEDRVVVVGEDNDEKTLYEVPGGFDLVVDGLRVNDMSHPFELEADDEDAGIEVEATQDGLYIRA